MSHWALLRILLEAATLVLAIALASRLLHLVVSRAPSTLHEPLAMLANLMLAALLLGVYVLLVRWLEHRPAIELSPQPGGAHLPLGILIGVILMGTVFLVLKLAGYADFTAGTGMAGLGAGLVGAFVVGVIEELLLRAVLFRVLEQAFGTTVALLVSAAIFGLLHGANPGATLFSDAAIAIEAGLLLALAYALTRNLWLAIGIHAGWNFAEGNLFGADVSGVALAPSLMRATMHGPEILTGGAFGPEASIVTIGVCLIASLIMATLIIRRGDWRPASLRWSLP